MKQFKKAWLAFVSVVLFLAGKMKWVCLYLALAVVLAVLTAYGQQIMDANQSLIS